MKNKDGDDEDINNSKYILGIYCEWNTILNTLYVYRLIHLIFTATYKIGTTCYPHWIDEELKSESL